MIKLTTILETNMKPLLKEKDSMPIAKSETTFSISPIDAIRGEDTLSGSRPFLKETIATKMVVKIRPIAAIREANKDIKNR